MTPFRAMIALAFLFSHFALAQTVATVGKSKIELKDFNKKYQQVKEKSINPPDKKTFLEDLIRYELGLLEAKKKNIAKDADVQERVNQVLYQSLVEKELGKKVENIKVSESEMKSYYRKNPEIRTAHILIELKQDAKKSQRAAAKKRAQDILAEVKKSKRKFSELVALYTDDIATKRSGGDIGWQTRLTLTPSYYNFANGLKKGAVGGLVETQFGYHIIKLVDRKSYKRANKRHIRQIVFDFKRKKLFDNYFTKLKQRYQIKKNTGVLK